MNRFLLLLAHEFKQARATLPIHLVTILEPALMYLLMTYILVQPTMTIYVNPSGSTTGQQLVEQMAFVGSPVGERFIKPVLTDLQQPGDVRQVIVVKNQNKNAIAVQKFNLIDANLLKNYRNRLTASAIRLWNEKLGGRAVEVLEKPLLPQDIPYNVYFGMAMLPLAAILSASLIGSALTAQEFETNTVLEYRLAPTSAWLILFARLIRVILTAAFSVVVLVVTIGLRQNYWPDSILTIILIVIPVSITAGSLGIVAGLITRNTLPAFIISLVTSFIGWIAGDAFKPASGISGWYETISRFLPTTHTVERLFPHYYGIEIGSATLAALVLFSTGTAMLGLLLAIYQKVVFKQE